jgi:hypothetical protein
MRVTAILDEDGQVIAATSGPVGDPESIVAAVGAEDGGGVVLTQGQTTREIEVRDELLENGNADEVMRHISDQLT